MAQLSAAERDKLPDRAFAYIDSHGRRRLPIADAPHVRNALARFNQVDFEDDEARERARLRLLRAAKKFRIVPVGFINSQLRAERVNASRTVDQADLPSGFVTMLMTDIEGSTTILDQLGDGYGDLLAEVRDIQRAAAQECGSIVVETRADEFFAVSDCPGSALETAIALQRQLRLRASRTDREVRVRAGIHAGYPTLHEANYIGMAVHTTARICAAAHGGQIVVSGDTRTALTGMVPDGVRFKRLGSHRLRGIPDEHHLFEVAGAGLTGRFPPLRT